MKRNQNKTISHHFENPFPGEVVAGIDEVGRGCLAGPVVAAVVILEDKSIVGIRDSKKLTKLKREALYQEIVNKSKWAIGMASAIEIDQINILQATMLAMSRAFDNLSTKCDVIAVDGNQIPNLPIYAVPFVKGDDRIIEIAAASIIAKVTRDKLMEELAEDFPEYGWGSNAGYGSKTHLAALEQLGQTPHHRKSFKVKAKQGELFST